MAREWYPTATQVISAAARGLGLVSSLTDISDPYGSSNTNILQLCQLLNDLGQDLLREHDWQQLRAVDTIDLSVSTEVSSTDGLVCESMPADFNRFVSESVWNRTSDHQLSGAVSAQEWQMLAAVGSTSTTSIRFRITNDEVRFWLTATQTGTVAYEYISRYWAGTSTTNRSLEAPTAASNVLYFDKRVLTEGLKLRFLEAKGFPADATLRSYERALALAKGHNAPAQTLSLNAPAGPQLPRLPDTEWGA